jgi:putative acetyltransferase
VEPQWSRSGAGQRGSASTLDPRRAARDAVRRGQARTRGRARFEAMLQLRFVRDDLTGAEIRALLRLHLDEMHRFSPPESVHALPIERLLAPDVCFYSAWDEAAEGGARLAGCGALRELDRAHGEIKSMRAQAEYRGRGVGKAILLHLLAEASARGYARVSLETGRPEAFLPARRLYESHGFVECPPFGDYRLDPFSICMTRAV